MSQERSVWAAMLLEKKPTESALQSTLLHHAVEGHIGALEREEYWAPQLRLRWRGEDEGVDGSIAIEDLVGICQGVAAAAGITGGSAASEDEVWATHLKMCINSATRAATREAANDGVAGDGGGGAAVAGGGGVFGGASAAAESAMNLSFNDPASFSGAVTPGGGGGAWGS